MATLYITEFEEASVFTNAVMAVVSPIWAQQTVAIAGASAQSSAFNVSTRFIRLCADVPCSVAFGTNPTAATTTLRLPADAVEYFAVPSRGAWKVAVIANT